MARYKILLLGALLTVFSFAALGFNVDINIDEVVSHGAYDLEYRENVSALQEINLTVENPGSIGCSYQMFVEFRGENFSATEYSKIHELWPGDSARMTVRQLPTNYKGNINGTVLLSYCGEEKRLENISYTWNTVKNSTETLQSRTLDSDERKAEIEVGSVKSGYLVPESYPAGWKVSSAPIREGKSRVEYDAPIFDRRRNLTYKVVNSEGELEGFTTFNLEEEESILRKVKERIWIILLIILLSANIVKISADKLNL